MPKVLAHCVIWLAVCVTTWGITLADEAIAVEPSRRFQTSTVPPTIPEFDLEYAVFVMGSDGSDLHPLCPGIGASGQGSPCWSHDGRRIVFDAWGQSNDLTAHVFVVDAAGGNATDLGPGGQPSWSPDDKQIVSQQYGNEWGTWVMTSDGKGREKLLYAAIGAQWSPDNTGIAAVVLTTSILAIFDLVNFQPRNILPGIEGGLGWSPDGKSICGRRAIGNGEFELMIVKPHENNGAPRVRLRGRIAPQMKWSPDGKWILFSMEQQSSNKIQLFVNEAEGESSPQ